MKPKLLMGGLFFLGFAFLVISMFLGMEHGAVNEREQSVAEGLVPSDRKELSQNRQDGLASFSHMDSENGARQQSRSQGLMDAGQESQNHRRDQETVLMESLVQNMSDLAAVISASSVSPASRAHVLATAASESPAEAYRETPKTRAYLTLWQGKAYTEIDKMSRKRLEENPADIPGLFMRMDYARAHKEYVTWAECATHVLEEIGGLPETSELRQLHPLILLDYEVQLQQLQRMVDGAERDGVSWPFDTGTPADVPPANTRYIAASEEDGLF